VERTGNTPGWRLEPALGKRLTDPIAIEDASVRSGEPVRRLRRWCETGALQCEHAGESWTLSEDQLGRVTVLAERRRLLDRGRHVIALALPAPIDPVELAREVARRLQLAQEAIAVRSIAYDRRAYVIAAWPEVDDPIGFERIEELAEELGGEVIERAGWRAVGGPASS
jgi:hypothetical protein